MIPDIYNSLAEKINFTYTLQMARDGQWGTIDKVTKTRLKDFIRRFQHGNWTGGVRDIMDGVADIGSAPFTASQIRSTVVDFSFPVIQVPIRFFIKNPEVFTKLGAINF